MSPPPPSPAFNPHRLLSCLYISHFLSSWGDNMWAFALALLFVIIRPDSLLLVALNGLVAAASVAALGVIVGHYVDSLSRRVVVEAALVIQNSSVLVAALGVMALLALNGEPTPPLLNVAKWPNLGFGNPGLGWVGEGRFVREGVETAWDVVVKERLRLGLTDSNNLFDSSILRAESLPLETAASPHSRLLFPLLVLLINAMAGVSALADLAINVAVERDWVVVVAKEARDEGMLVKVNSQMRRIDLVCKLMAPSAVGLLMSLVSPFTATLVLALWNVGTAFIEYYLLMIAYEAVPALARKNGGAGDAHSGGVKGDLETFLLAGSPSERVGLEGGEREREGSSGNDIKGNKEGSSDIINNGAQNGVKGLKRGGATERERGCFGSLLERAQKFGNGWSVYWRQESLLPAISLACLYLTVLSFGALMTAELSWQGVPFVILGSVRGVAALTGIAGTLLYPILESRFSAVVSGLWATWLQWVFLLLCVVGVFFQGMLSASLLMVGVILSRVGLWMFDLSVVQIVQMSVPEGERGVVGGVQGSIQQIFNMSSFFLAIVVSRPDDFWILVLISFGFVSIAALLYTVYALRKLERSGDLSTWNEGVSA